jgi:hypothetical protein
MTEAKLRALPALQTMPICDESDEQANAITNGDGWKVRECKTMQEVEDCLKDPKLVPLGGLRVKSGGKDVVVVYFGEVP